MRKVHKKKTKKQSNQDLKIGEGFMDTRGYNAEVGPTPKHNGLNINNEPVGYEEREKEKQSRR